MIFSELELSRYMIVVGLSLCWPGTINVAVFSYLQSLISFHQLKHLLHQLSQLWISIRISSVGPLASMVQRTLI